MESVKEKIAVGFFKYDKFLIKIRFSPSHEFARTLGLIESKKLTLSDISQNKFRFYPISSPLMSGPR